LTTNFHFTLVQFQSLLQIIPPVPASPQSISIFKMCVRTKTSYGCGHVYKQDEICHHPRSCAGLERYHFVKDGDCRQCKSGGEGISRGREGQGRYARELQRKDRKLPIIQIPLSTISDNPQSSPWASPMRKEKNWTSPIRKKADKAWEEEKVERENDLLSRSPSSRGGSVQYLESYSSHEPQRRDDRGATIQEQRHLIEEAERIRNRRRREREASYDSFDSFGGSHQSYSSGLHSQDHYSSGHRSHHSDRSRFYDSGFGSKQNPYNLYNTQYYFSGLGQGIGGMVKESSKRWARW
jgi:hypothetical protein